MGHNFFLYGSFAQGHVHYPKVVNLIEHSKAGFVRGEVYRMRCGYPGLAPAETGELIPGVMAQLKTTESFWPIMDQIMGYDSSHPDKGLFVRRHVSVKVDDYGESQAQTYVLHPKRIVKAYENITRLGWQESLEANPPLLQAMQPRHRNYIIKLAQSKGRDIVPIQLDLYRELMALDMIVDKGRRLALTPLGKEVSLFIQ